MDLLVGDTIVLSGLQRPETDEEALRLRGTQPGSQVDFGPIEMLIKKPDAKGLRSLMKLHGKLKAAELCFNIILWTTFLILPDISIALFQLYDCETFDDGASRLKAAYDVSCTSDVHTAFCLYGALQILVWPVGYASHQTLGIHACHLIFACRTLQDSLFLFLRTFPAPQTVRSCILDRRGTKRDRPRAFWELL